MALCIIIGCTNFFGWTSYGFCPFELLIDLVPFAIKRKPNSKKGGKKSLDVSLFSGGAGDSVSSLARDVMEENQMMEKTAKIRNCCPCGCCYCRFWCDYVLLYLGNATVKKAQGGLFCCLSWKKKKVFKTAVSLFSRCIWSGEQRPVFVWHFQFLVFRTVIGSVGLTACRRSKGQIAKKSDRTK